METTDEVDSVLGAIDATARTFTDSVISAGAALNCLLDLWAVVHDLDQTSAGPVEQLIVALNRRSYTTPEELGNAIEMTRILVAASRRSS